VPSILHLGVIDQFYGTPSTIKGAPAPVSTGDVAVILENKYGIMRAFASLNSFFIVNEMEKSLAKAVRQAAVTGHVTTEPFAVAMTKIESKFKDFLSLSTIETMGWTAPSGLPIPTLAALKGISSRTKAGRYKNNRKGKAGQNLKARRPSFIDTGLYQSSFKAWYEKRK